MKADRENFTFAKMEALEPIMMRKFPGFSRVCLLGVAAAFLASTPARAADERVWTLSGLEEKAPTSVYLGFGVPETDDVVVSFNCKPRSGEVKVFVPETSQKLKPGKKATAVLSVGETKATATGKLLPNEEAGVPSFGGRLPAADPVFAAMAGGESIAVAVGPATSTAPLKGAAEKVKKFALACAKP